ncbi:Uncharacterised protein [Streptococcus pneumoniae]|nr:Uncharacterised protein [Streptococcus pneumoniae]
MIISTPLSKFINLTASIQPFRIASRLFVMMIFLAFLCFAIASAQIVLPLPPRASKKIPLDKCSLLLIASACHFLSVIVILTHHLSDIMNHFFNIISHCPK